MATSRLKQLPSRLKTSVAPTTSSISSVSAMPAPVLSPDEYTAKQNVTVHAILALIENAAALRGGATHKDMHTVRHVLRDELAYVYGKLQHGVHVFNEKVHEFAVKHLLGCHSADHALHEFKDLYHEFSQGICRLLRGDEALQRRMAELDAESDDD